MLYIEGVDADAEFAYQTSAPLASLAVVVGYGQFGLNRTGHDLIGTMSHSFPAKQLNDSLMTSVLVIQKTEFLQGVKIWR